MGLFSRLREPDYDTLDKQAQAILADEDKGAILNRAANNEERYKLCVKWAEQARDDFYAGRRETIAAVVSSRNRKYRHYPYAVRVSIGERIWGNSLKAKEFVGLEQMYSRWAAQYKAGPEHR